MDEEVLVHEADTLGSEEGEVHDEGTPVEIEMGEEVVVHEEGTPGESEEVILPSLNYIYCNLCQMNLQIKSLNYYKNRHHVKYECIECNKHFISD